MQPAKVWGVMLQTRYVVGASARKQSVVALTLAPQSLCAAPVARPTD